MYQQLDIYWVELNPTRGAETFKNRPCVILQTDFLNRHTKTLLVAPLLPQHQSWSFAVNVSPSHHNGMDKDRHINLKQMRAVDISRLGRQQGTLEQRYLPSIHEALQTIFGMA